MSTPLYKYYAPVAPLPLLKDIMHHNLQGSNVMLLAHDVLANEDAYLECFHYGGAYATLGKTQIILDNSAAELSEPLKPNDLIKAANIVRANYLCMPDYLYDKTLTLRALKEFLDHINNHTSYFTQDTQILMIPQGQTNLEILECAQAQVELLGGMPIRWGIPRWIANEFGSREPTIKGLLSPFQFSYGRIHLLGMSKHTDDDIHCCKLPGVIGIDSANPLVLGQQFIHLFNSVKQAQNPHPNREDSNYWESTELTDESIVNMVKLRSVIQGEVPFGSGDLHE